MSTRKGAAPRRILAHLFGWPRWILRTASLVCVFLVGAAGFLGDAGTPLLARVIASTIAALLAAGITELRRWVEDGRAEKATADALDAKALVRVQYDDFVRPVLDAIRLMSARKRERGEDLAKILQSVLATATQLTDPDRVRAVWFEYKTAPNVHDDGDQADGTDGRARLEPTAHYGRGDTSHTTFVEGTVEGDFAIGLVGSSSEYLCRDTTADPPQGWDASRERAYRSFLSVGVSTTARKVGMLSVDTVEPQGLDEGNAAIIRGLASLYGVAVRCAESNLNTTPSLRAEREASRNA